MNPPRVVILSAGPPEQLREICAGLEEEGVPFTVLSGEEEALGLAVEAANRSTLEVGIGLDRSGLTVVHHSKLPTDKPVSRSRDARKAGQDAARVVTGAPLTPKESP